MRKLWIICFTVCIILLILLAAIVFRGNDGSRLESERSRFSAVHAQRYDELTHLIRLLDAVEADCAIRIHNGEAVSEGDQESDKASDRIPLQAVAECAAELFGDEFSIRKRTEQDATIIVIDKTIDISRNPFTHSWVSISLWYCDDPSSQAMQQQIQMHEDTMIRLDPHFTLITVGLV